MEQRKAQRVNTKLKIMLISLDEEDSEETIMADVLNVSKTGLCFVSPQEIKEHTFFRARLVLESKESMETIIETVRHEPSGDEEYQYGGRFVGLSDVDQFKIEVFRLFAENELQSQER